MSYSESYRDLPGARSTGREAVRVAGRAVLIASAAILGDVLLFGFVLVYAGVFEFWTWISPAPSPPHAPLNCGAIFLYRIRAVASSAANSSLGICAAQQGRAWAEICRDH